MAADTSYALVYRVAVLMARQHGGYEDGTPETWANFSGEATEIVELIRDIAQEDLQPEAAAWLTARLDEAVTEFPE